jgi:reactive intermediate/imine deaminase
MPRKTISTSRAAPPGGPYSQAVVAGDFVYLAGAVPMRPDGSWVNGTAAEQARQVFTNLAEVAREAGADLSQTVRVNVYLRDFDDFAEMNLVFGEVFGSEPPVRTTLPVALNGFDVEADAVLYTGS